MVIGLILVVGILAVCFLGGAALIIWAFRKPPMPPSGELPVAQVKTGDYSRIQDLHASKSRAPSASRSTRSAPTPNAASGATRSS